MPHVSGRLPAFIASHRQKSPPAHLADAQIPLFLLPVDATAYVEANLEAGSFAAMGTEFGWHARFLRNAIIGQTRISIFILANCE